MISGEDEKIYYEMKNQVDEIIKFDDFKAAHNLAERLTTFEKKKNYDKNNPEMNRALSFFVAELKWVSLNFLTEDEAIELFKNHFDLALKMSYFDLWDKFKLFLIGIYLHKERDRFKKEIKKILEKNQLIITSLDFDDKRKPTIENWIKLYISEVGLGSIDRMTMQNFLVNNVEVKKLGNEKDRIIKLFEFYEKLKLSSFTAAGVEEIIPVDTDEFKGYIRDGNFEKKGSLAPDQQRIFNVVIGSDFNTHFFELEEEKNNYKSNSLEIKTIEENLSKKEKLDELRKVADSYKPGSLQKRAIEEEIKKLENK